jgi:hypothetical protein
VCVLFPSFFLGECAVFVSRDRCGHDDDGRHEEISIQITKLLKIRRNGTVYLHIFMNLHNYM